tara:strand:- start:1043 stop:1444 length:402 start_codon:yes stop_codon:yes gene_type:complete
MNKDALIAECEFKAVRSSGAGGQHVNKTSTKVQLSWDLESSNEFDDEQKEQLRNRLTNRLTKANVLNLSYDNSRSQHKNKEQVIRLFIQLIEKALEKQKVRKKTKPSKISKLKRLKAKKQHSEKKTNRKPPKF